MSGGLPWTGTMDLPPSSVNHAYRPVVRRKKDGGYGIGFAKADGYEAWSQGQLLLLRQQRIPHLVAGTQIALILEQRVKNVRADVDGMVKAVMDVLALALTPVEGPAWDDRDCYLLVASKVVDKANPGITVTVQSYDRRVYANVRQCIQEGRDG